MIMNASNDEMAYGNPHTAMTPNIPFLKIAHRGYSERYPENTLPAFEQAVLAGADMIELDIHLSRDGQIVVIHDDTIDRTSNGSGPVSGLTFAELRKYNYNNGMAVQGFVEIPSLADVIDLVGNRVLLNVEIKKDQKNKEVIVKKLVDLLEKKKFIDRVVVSSFGEEILREMHRTAGYVRTGMLYDAAPRDFREKVRALGAYSVHPAIRAMEPEQLRWAKGCGLMVYPWVAKDRKTIEQCRTSGYVDGIMVNEMALLAAS